jgi:hypothetical protein
MSETDNPAEAAGTPYRFDCHMSYLHRYIPADGTWVGLNGFDKIILNFFNDSPPLPSTITTETVPGSRAFVSKDPKLGFATDAGAIRRYEASIVLSLQAAKGLQDTLGKIINLAESQQKKQVEPK